MKNLKKTISLLLAVIIMATTFTALPFTASAAENLEMSEVGASSGTTGDCTWTLDDEGVLTISGNGEMDDFSYEYDYKNDSIITTAPWGTNIKSVVIENGVTSIGEFAFHGCTGLTSVTIPDSVTSIGDSAFSDCTGLTSVTIPDSVTSIGWAAFEDCAGLTSITIPDSVTSIDDSAFYGCKGLTSVTIPDGVTSIGSNAFYNTAWYNNQPDGLIYAGKVAYTYKGTMPSNTSIVIKEGTKGIADSAFYECTGLTSVTIGNSVTSIGNWAFYECTGLTSITIPDSVTNVGNSAFSGCTGLTNVAIPDSVTSIGEEAFRGCAGLTSVTIGNSVTSIGYSAFYDCTSLTSVTIGNSVTSIGSWAFFYCTGLTSVTIPDSVTSIGGGAFRECESLTSVTIPDSVTSIGDDAFSDCTGLTSVTIPDSVTSIGDHAFGYDYIYRQYQRINDFTIYGVKGSEAEKYANDNGFIFVDVDSITSQTYTDEETNISVTADEGLTLQVVEKNETETGDIVISKEETVHSVYDISLLKDGSEAQPEGSVTVKIPCDVEGAKVYRVEQDKSLTDMNAVYENGYLVFTTEHFSLYVVSVPKTYTTGDVNGDNNVDVLDAAAIQKHASGKAELNSDQLAAADVNGDGNVDVLDAAEIQKFAAGKITEFKKKV